MNVKLRTIGLALAVVCAIAQGPVQAKEQKIGYVDSDRILEASEDFRAAKQKLQEEERQYITQAQALEKIVTDMMEDLKSQSLLLSDEARRDREGRLRGKQEELDAFRKETWGEGGKLYTRNLELSKPVLDRINTAIEKVSQAENYDFVFDAVNANIVYAQPEYDLTDKVLDELKKE
ncbi:OmpH family outer membrane protein [candidate division KSB1 bacterium]|nr:OmpH family outer membrane protein [candidate division KSB1 bacterium]